jgi:hypothetical protein
MCDIDKYIFEEDDEFYNENRNFLKITLYLLYLMVLINIITFIYVSIYIL